MRRMSGRIQLLLAGLVGTLLPAVYAFAQSPCPGGLDTCAGRPACNIRTPNGSEISCITATDSSGVHWCCNYELDKFICGNGLPCSIKYLTSASEPCSC